MVDATNLWDLLGAGRGMSTVAVAVALKHHPGQPACPSLLEIEFASCLDLETSVFFVLVLTYYTTDLSCFSYLEARKYQCLSRRNMVGNDKENRTCVSREAYHSSLVDLL